MTSLQISDHHIVPDTAELAERPKLCLTDAISHTVSIDYTQLFDHKTYSVNTNLGKKNRSSVFVCLSVCLSAVCLRPIFLCLFKYENSMLEK